MTKFILLPIFFMLFALVNAQSHVVKVSPRDNYVIVLDLSDRLLTEHQVSRDKELIRTVLNRFEEGVKAKYYIASADRIKIVVAPQRNSPVDVAKYEQALYIDMSKVGMAHKKNVAQLTEKLYASVEKLYADASRYQKKNEYQGADLWKYFNEYLAYDFTADSRYSDRNYLLVLTDGYLDFESYTGRRQAGNRYTSTTFVRKMALQKEKWKTLFEQQDYGVLQVKNSDFPQVKVMVLDVNPHAEYHGEILEATWRKWLGEMQIKTVQFMLKGNMVTAKEQIHLYLQ